MLAVALNLLIPVAHLLIEDMGFLAFLTGDQNDVITIPLMGNAFDGCHKLFAKTLAAGPRGDDDILYDHKRPAIPYEILADDTHHGAQQLPVHIST
ncbi:hypothetical protein D3C81_1802120 [compost metagenome]